MSFLSTSPNDDLASILPFLPVNLASKHVLFVDAGSDETTLNTFVGQNVARLLVLNLNSTEARPSSNQSVEYLNSNLNEFDLGEQRLILFQTY
jgi:hypothetical protein